MKKTRKLLATLLTFAMVFGIFAGTSLPVMAAEQSGTSDLYWALDSEGTLTITGTGAMPKWNKPDNVPWHSYVNVIEEVVIDNGVTSIGEEAFNGYGNLRSITIPESITSIGQNAFAGCYALESVTLPGNLNTLGENAFHGCSNLTEITIPAGVTKIATNVFEDCTGLEQVTFMGAVTEIGRKAFSGCTGLTEITIPAGVTTIGRVAFQDCTNLTTVTFAGATPPTTNSTAFDGCNSITTIKVPAGAEAAYRTALTNAIDLNNVSIETYTSSIRPSDGPSKPAKKEHSEAAKEEVHEHSYSWVTVQEAGVGQDGIEEYRCSCGDVKERNVIPATQAYVNELMNSIEHAPTANGKIELDTGRFYTMSDAIIKKLAERSDVITEITFEYQGIAYKMTVPAGIDYTAILADDERFYGYFYFAQLIGATIETR